MIYETIFKRFFDLVISLCGIIIFFPIIFIFAFIIFVYDKSFPFYIAPRVGKNSKEFKIIKLRSMIINADKNKVDSTSINDIRITPIGNIIRKYKLDEITQLINVFLGHMSLVGPRPNVKRETNTYSDEEKKILEVRPGITDFSSIIFSDEGEILEESKDPDLDYNQLIRPIKSRLAIFYINNISLKLDTKIILITALSIIKRNIALKIIHKILCELDADTRLIKTSLRNEKLQPMAPPGLKNIVSSREI